MVEFSFIGQRADKSRAEFNDMENIYEIIEYTISCPDCGAEGVYDERGDIVCSRDVCGVLIAGPERKTVMPVDHSGSRGFENGESQERYSKLERSEKTTRGPRSPP